MACANGLVAIVDFFTIVFAVGHTVFFGSILEINVVAIVVPLLFSLQMDTISLDFGLSLFICTGSICVVSGSNGLALSDT